MINCEVCNSHPAFVVSSPFGPINNVLCGVCSNLQIQPWTALVGGLFSCDKELIDIRVGPIIEATCRYYNKTENDLWEEIKQLEINYEKHIIRFKHEYDNISGASGGPVVSMCNKCGVIKVCDQDEKLYFKLGMKRSFSHTWLVGLDEEPGCIGK